MAGVRRLAAALGHRRGLGLAADLRRVLEHADAEVARRVAADLVEDVGQDVGAEQRQALPGHAVAADAVVEDLGGGLEPLGNVHLVFIVKDALDDLQLALGDAQRLGDLGPSVGAEDCGSEQFPLLR